MKQHLFINNLDELQQVYGKWSEVTFPKNDLRSWCNHIRDEVDELEEGNDPLEAADIVLMLLDHAARNNYSLMDAIKVKFDMLRSRTWKPQNELGIVKHDTKGPVEQAFMANVYDGTQNSLNYYIGRAAYQCCDDQPGDAFGATVELSANRHDQSWKTRGEVGTHMFK